MDRRTFLKHTSASALGLGLGGILPCTAQSQGWGQLPAGTTWPTPVKVLEIFCYSGLSQWETFWLSEGVGNTKNWRGLQTDITELSWHCSANPSPTTESTLFGEDAREKKVYWGPATKPLWRNDIFSRTRMVAISHDLQPHALAIPLALTGHRLGNPRAAGKGAVIQHRQASRLTSSAIPYSYVIGPDDLGPFAFTIPAAASNGTHPGYAQPLVIRIGDPTFQSILQRSQMSADSDNLIRTYQAMGTDRLRFQGQLVRSTELAGYNSAVDSVRNAPALNALLNTVSLNVMNTSPCASAHRKNDPRGTPSSQLAPSPNKTRTELDLATALLATGGARYVCVIDRGLDHENGNAKTPYDLHEDNDGSPAARILSNNVFNLCTLLAERIDENIPEKIHLNDTLIIIHSEFGRTPDLNVANRGRDHWPYGYAAVLIGGPLVTRSIAGGINATGFAFGPPGTTGAYTPTDVHAAVLLAAGVNPFEQENFGVRDFSTLVATATTKMQNQEDAVRVNLKTKILGL